jgi:hypothetical protein
VKRELLSTEYKRRRPWGFLKPRAFVVSIIQSVSRTALALATVPGSGLFIQQEECQQQCASHAKVEPDVWMRT